MIPEFLQKFNHEIIVDGVTPVLKKVEFLPFEECPASVKYKLAEKYEADINADGETTPEYFDCPLRENCQAKAKPGIVSLSFELGIIQ